MYYHYNSSTQEEWCTGRNLVYLKNKETSNWEGKGEDSRIVDNILKMVSDRIRCRLN
jgi:hypothetical protein